jgi:pimeloyl-ACP methyl ester carboxylesterase
MVGERDIPDCLRIAELLEERIPDSRKVVLPGVGHASNMEDPDSFNETVLEVLAELDRR